MSKLQAFEEIVSDPELREACRPQVLAENWPEVAKTALGCLEQRLRRFRKKRRDGDLPTVIGRLFNDNNGEYHFPFCQESGHQRGMMFLYQGSAQSLRNLTHHEGLTVDSAEALDIVGLVNFLLRSAEKAKKGTLKAGKSVPGAKLAVPQSLKGVSITFLPDEQGYGYYGDNSKVSFHLMWRLINDSGRTIEAKIFTLEDASGTQLKIVHGPTHYEKYNRRSEFVLPNGDNIRMALIGGLSGIPPQGKVQVTLAIFDVDNNLLVSKTTILSAQRGAKS